MTRHYLIHDATGRILRAGSCPAGQMENQAASGETAVPLDAALPPDFDETRWCWRAGALHPAEPLPFDAAGARKMAAAQVERLVDMARGRFIPERRGQEWVYHRKEQEARLLLAGAAFRPAAFPHIHARMQATGQSERGVAGEFARRADALVAASAALELAKDRALAAIHAADTQAAVDAALTTFNTDLETII